MTFPTIGMPEDDDSRRAALRAAFLEAAADDSIDTSEVKQTDEQPAPRRRGRPPGSKNRPKPSDFAPTGPNVSQPLPTLANPPLSTRDQKEVAKRLAGILEGVTGVAAVAKPYFQMTPEEAESIATPLSTYLIRTEGTSGVAKQILEEYDIAAFVIALAAYVVRVYSDMRAERAIAEMPAQVVNDERKAKKPSVREQTDSKRDLARTIGSIVQEPNGETEVGTEGSVSRQFASTSERSWVPSDL